jgi:hypothetical protein
MATNKRSYTQAYLTEHRERLRILRQDDRYMRKVLGICRDCSLMAEKGKTLCAKCLTKRKNRYKLKG